MLDRDQRTYDLAPPNRSPVPWRPLAVLSVVAVLALALTAFVLGGSRSRPVPPPSSPSVTSSEPSPPGASPQPSGSDADEGLAMPEGSQDAAVRFVRAWLDRNPKTRKPALRATASAELADELAMTDAANIPKAFMVGRPALEDASTYSARFTQALSSGLRIEVYLVADPAASYGWLATSVDRA